MTDIHFFAQLVKKRFYELEGDLQKANYGGQSFSFITPLAAPPFGEPIPVGNRSASSGFQQEGSSQELVVSIVKNM